MGTWGQREETHLCWVIADIERDLRDLGLQEGILARREETLSSPTSFRQFSSSQMEKAIKNVVVTEALGLS